VANCAADDAATQRLNGMLPAEQDWLLGRDCARCGVDARFRILRWLTGCSLSPWMLTREGAASIRRLYGLMRRTNTAGVRTERLRAESEADVRFVEVTPPRCSATTTGPAQRARRATTNAMVTDQAVTALVTDLKSRAAEGDPDRLGRERARRHARDGGSSAGFTICWPGGVAGADPWRDRRAGNECGKSDDCPRSARHEPSPARADHSKLTYRRGRDYAAGCSWPGVKEWWREAVLLICAERLHHAASARKRPHDPPRHRQSRPS
jgi:hypothetical protein